MTSPPALGRKPMPVMAWRGASARAILRCGRRLRAARRFWSAARRCFSAAARCSARRSAAALAEEAACSAAARCAAALASWLVFLSAADFSAAARWSSRYWATRSSSALRRAAESGRGFGRDPTRATVGSEARFWASRAAGLGEGTWFGRGLDLGASFASSGARRGTRTSTLEPWARTSNSASAVSSMTTRAVRDPASAVATRWMVPSSTTSSSGAPDTSVSAKSTTTRGGPESFRVVKLRGRSPTSSMADAAASPPAVTPSSLPCSCACAAQTRLPARAHPRVNFFFSFTRFDGNTRWDTAQAIRSRGELQQVLHVLADLVDVRPHGQFEVAVPLHRPPDQVPAARLAVDAAGAVAGSDLVLVPEDDRHGNADVLEVRLVVVAGGVALHLVVADP